jgi:hypothetical protein
MTLNCSKELNMSNITMNISKYLQAAGMNAYEFAPIIGMEATVVYAHARGRAMTQLVGL